ncbi:MAG: TonB-dependent receptor [Oligoflexales bacterium]|nr:TonB-dependent receptor [Oligoflexales bacterium]
MFSHPHVGVFYLISILILCRPTLQAETIIVSAVQLPQEVPLGSHTDVIEEEEIQNTRFRDVLDVLEATLGLYIQRSNSLQQDKINVRGFTGQQIKILVNGLPFESAGSSLQDLLLIPKESISRIYVSRGAMSSVYGNSAMGGVINIITNPLLEDKVGLPINNLKMGVGSFGKKNIAGRFSRKAKTFKLSLSSLYESESGKYVVRNKAEKELFDSAQYQNKFTLQNNDSENYALNAAASHPFGTANIVYSTTDRGVPGRVGHRLYSVRQQNRALRADFLSGDLRLLKNELKVGIYAADILQVLDDPAGEINGFKLHQEQESKSGGVEINSQLYLNFFEKNNIVPHWRILFAQETFSFAEEGHSRDTASFSLGFNWNFINNCTLTTNMSLVTASHETSQSSQGLSINYELLSNLFLKSNYVEGFRYPSFVELYTQQGSVVGNSNLNPEKNRGFDFGFELIDNKVKLGVNYFRYDSKNLIEYVSVSGFQYKPFNFSRARAEGVETSFHTKWADKFSSALNLTLQNNEDSDPHSEYFGKKIPGQAQFFGTVALDYQVNPSTAFYISQMFARDRYVNRANTEALADSKQLDVGGRFKIRENLGLNLDVKNALNEQNEDLRGYALPNRSYYVSLDKTFI